MRERLGRAKVGERPKDEAGWGGWLGEYVEIVEELKERMEVSRLSCPPFRFLGFRFDMLIPSSPLS